MLWNHAALGDETFEVLRGRLCHFHVHTEVLDPENDEILRLARRMKAVDYAGCVSLEIIEGKNLPEGLLTGTATRLKGFMRQA